MTQFSNRAAARRSVDTLLAHPFERLVVGHGAPVTTDAHGALEGAMSFLRPSRSATTSLAPPRAPFGKPSG